MPAFPAALERSIIQNLQWLQTMKQERGYAGPVTHYWGNSLSYTGHGTDWRYEGLMHAFVILYQKTNQSIFLEKAMECGDFIVNAQLPTGAFRNSSFEANPSFQYSGTPHEAGVCIALIELVKLLREEKKPHQSYLMACLNNIEKIQIGKFWDAKSKTFYQYQRKRIVERRNLIVPNKIATTCEALLGVYQLTKKNVYRKMAITASAFILRHQDTGEHVGGIYQSDTRSRIIPYYTARCVPLLIELFKLTKDEKYLESAGASVSYIQKHRLQNGFFSFGESFEEEKNARSPVFLAGVGDIGRAFDVMAEYRSISSRPVVRALLSVQRKNGAFPTKWEHPINGKKNTHSWKDILGVVGWNDKSLRFMSQKLENGVTLEEKYPFPATREICTEGIFTETAEHIRVEGTETYSWVKTESFSRPCSPLKPLAYQLGNSGLPILQTLGSRAWKNV